MRQYTRKQIKSLGNDQYVLVIIDGLVYDLTSYVNQHPGGADILKSVSGTDASQKFRDVGHSITALKRRQSFLIGELQDQSFFKWRWWYLPIIATGLLIFLNKTQNLKKINK